MNAQICRELDRLELLLEQVRTVEQERDRLMLGKDEEGIRRILARQDACA